MEEQEIDKIIDDILNAPVTEYEFTFKQKYISDPIAEAELSKGFKAGYQYVMDNYIPGQYLKPPSDLDMFGKWYANGWYEGYTSGHLNYKR